MFTGLIQDLGKLEDLRRRGNYHVLTISSRLADETVRIGESIACDGACLTVVATAPGRFVVEASQETAGRTILDDYCVGRRINLERALKVGDCLGGHFVQGHVDDVGVVDYARRVGESTELAVRYAVQYDRWVIPKGSIAVNGISLTVNEMRPGWLSVNLIPHTAAMTTAAGLTAGQRVNVEFDMMAKYMEKYAHHQRSETLTLEVFKRSGW